MIKLRPDIKKGDIFSLVQYVILPIFRKDGIPLELNLVILHIYCTCKYSKTIFSAGYVFEAEFCDIAYKDTKETRKNVIIILKFKL